MHRRVIPSRSESLWVGGSVRSKIWRRHENGTGGGIEVTRGDPMARRSAAEMPDGEIPHLISTLWLGGHCRGDPERSVRRGVDEKNSFRFPRDPSFPTPTMARESHSDRSLPSIGALPQWVNPRVWSLRSTLSNHCPTNDVDQCTRAKAVINILGEVIGLTR